jgi:hypothetical protein
VRRCCCLQETFWVLAQQYDWLTNASPLAFDDERRAKEAKYKSKNAKEKATY